MGLAQKSFRVATVLANVELDMNHHHIPKYIFHFVHFSILNTVDGSTVQIIIGLFA